MNLLPYVEDHRVRFNSDAIGADSSGVGSDKRTIPDRIYTNGEPKCGTVFCTVGGMPDAGHRHDGFPILGEPEIPYDPLMDDSFLPGTWPVWREVRQLSAEVDIQIKPLPAIGGQPGIEDGPALVNIFLEDPQDGPSDRGNFKVRPGGGTGARINGWADVPGPGADPGEVITVNLAGTVIQSPFIDGDPEKHYEPGRFHREIGFALSKRRLLFMPVRTGTERFARLSVDAELFRTEGGASGRVGGFGGKIGFSGRAVLDSAGTVMNINGRTTPSEETRFATGFSILLSFPETTTVNGVTYLFKKWKVDGVNFGWEPTPDNFTASTAGSVAIRVRQCMSDCFVTAVYEEQ